MLPSGGGVNEVESPNGQISGSEVNSSSVNFTSLQVLIDECQAGDWTLYIDRGSSGELQYYFTVTVTNLTTNTLPRVAILSPPQGATGVVTNPAFAWAGLTNFSSIFVNAYRLGDSSAGNATLTAAATNWPAGPALAVGTNRFSVNYELSNFDDVTVSEPLNGSSNPLASWSATVNLATESRVEFIVSGAIPQPVTVINPQVAGGNFSFSFLTQSGRTHTVQSRTNLTLAPWVDVTNFPGNNSLKQIVLPIDSNPETYFRIGTQ